ncbi:class A beta-lactamase [Kosakonia oryziphila]|uniref:Beta-lactamase n=1 Tax=Kosakonia oryziphila TaxID=1005667 RepID=A0A1C4CPP1_9ENTR|nr:class A beta-lactamase [Kosakonia oryziphila]SCC21042.1 beta-lactamase class A [Kosakonia oryziphila]
MFFSTKSICSLLLIFLPLVHAAAMDSARLANVVHLQEQQLGARIGVAVLDTASSKTVSYRGDERFPLNSTHKALLCGALLSKVDKGELALTESTQFPRSALVEYSPITEKFVAPARINWQQLCSAAVSYSDNTAANLLAQKLGGPAAITQYLQTLGDSVTRLDRVEPELNSAVPGDERDTTTPLAVSRTLQKLTLGTALKPGSRAQLIQWMREDKVADALLRSTLPAGWTIADKTGAGDFGSRSIISVVWPKNSTPRIVVIYITNTKATSKQSNAAIASLGKEIFSAIK